MDGMSEIFGNHLLTCIQLPVQFLVLHFWRETVVVLQFNYLINVHVIKLSIFSIYTSLVSESHVSFYLYLQQKCILVDLIFFDLPIFHPHFCLSWQKLFSLDTGVTETGFEVIASVKRISEEPQTSTVHNL